MRKIIISSLVLIILALVMPLEHASIAGTSFTVASGTEIADVMIDGVIGTEWDDANNYAEVTIMPKGTATIWTKHDQTNLYIAIQFTSETSTPWLAIAFDSVGYMRMGSDGAVFGDTNSPTPYADVHYVSQGPWGVGVKYDVSQNGAGAMKVVATATYVVTAELRKSLKSGDTDGRDIEWSVGGTYNLAIAWDSDGGGNPGGGTANHRSGIVGCTVFIEGPATGVLVIPLESMVFLVGVIVLIVFDVILVFKRRRTTTRHLKGARTTFACTLENLYKLLLSLGLVKCFLL